MSSEHAHGLRRRRRRSRKRQPSLGERSVQWLQRALWPRAKTTRTAHPATAKERWQAVSWVVALIAVFVVTLSLILNSTNDSNPESSPGAGSE